MFSFERKVEITMFFCFFIPIPDTSDFFFTAKDDIAGAYTIDSLQKELQKVCDEKFALLIEQNIRDKNLISIRNLKN